MNKLRAVNEVAASSVTSAGTPHAVMSSQSDDETVSISLSATRLGYHFPTCRYELLPICASKEIASEEGTSSFLMKSSLCDCVFVGGRVLQLILHC